MALPDHTRLLVERHLSRYCDRICPPTFERQVRLDYRIERDRVIVSEVRPIYGSPGMTAVRHAPLALFRHDAENGTWRFYYRDLEERWRRYHPLPRARDFLTLLRELDRDPRGIFWDRVDGKSLRWCSAKGRCSGCSARYEQILGLCPLAGRSTVLPIDTARVSA
jgi:hypothetical protein